MEFTGKLLAAFAFAVEKHRYQRRKDRRLSPYVNHLVDVANILYHQGEVRDEDMLVAAILHDTLEDTNTSEKEIEDQFGSTVLKYVKEVSDDKSKPKDVRKRLQVLTASSKSDGAKQIALSDKIANLTDLVERPPANWPSERRRAYSAWAKEVTSGMRGTNLKLEEILDKRIQQVLNDQVQESAYLPQPAQSY